MEALLNKCVEELMKIEYDLRILGGRVEPGDWRGGEGSSTVYVLVKNLRTPSTDEAPLVASILEALNSIESVERVEVYEYEPLEGGPGRSARAAEVLRRALASKSGVIAVIPSLLVVSLLSRLGQEAAEALEGAILATVHVRFDNVLYLPDPSVSSVVEIVAKKNSESSYERVEWLKAKAKELGINVRGSVYLEDNTEILSYVSEAGPKGIYERIPATKLAKALLAVTRCTGLGGLRELRRVEGATHTIYALGVDSEVGEGILNTIREALSKPVNPIRGSILEEHVSGNLASYLEKVIDRLGLTVVKEG